MSKSIQHFSPEVANKVAYEFRMLMHDFDSLLQLDVELDQVSPGDVMPRLGSGIATEEVRDASAFLESFLIHARVLREFFCNDRSRADDVIASDFVVGWRRPLASELSYLSAQKQRLDKALAHLTTTRVQYDLEGKQWDVGTIMRELKPVINRFVSELPEDLKKWFELS